MVGSRFSFSVERPLRWGVIGCGSVCEIKSVPAYQLTPGFRVDAVMSRQGEKVADYAKRHGIPKWTTCARELIHDPQIDAVYIATPPNSHAGYALQVAGAGKICCVEKPMASNYRDALAIYTAFARRDLPLFVAYYRRSLPRFQKVGAWLDAGSIGEVQHYSWVKHRPASTLDLSGTPQWRTDMHVAPGGYFDDLASHGLDLFAQLFGEIQAARGSVHHLRGLYTAPDSIRGDWVHTSGVRGKGSWNFVAQERQDRVHIQGSRGSLSFAVLDEAPLILESGALREQLVLPHPPQVQLFHVGNIKSHLLGQSVHPSLGGSALRTQWAMEQILSSGGGSV